MLTRPTIPPPEPLEKKDKSVESKKKSFDWKEMEVELAKKVCSEIVGSPEFKHTLISGTTDQIKIIARRLVNFSRTVISELKKGEGDSDNG